MARHATKAAVSSELPKMRRCQHHGSGAMKQIQQKISCGSHKCLNGRRAGTKSRCPMCRYLHSIAKPIDTPRPKMLGDCESDICHIPANPAVTADFADGLDKIKLCAECADAVRWMRQHQRSNEVASGDQGTLS